MSAVSPGAASQHGTANPVSIVPKVARVRIKRTSSPRTVAQRHTQERLPIWDRRPILGHPMLGHHPMQVSSRPTVIHMFPRRIITQHTRAQSTWAVTFPIQVFGTSA